MFKKIPIDYMGAKSDLKPEERPREIGKVRIHYFLGKGFEFSNSEIACVDAKMYAVLEHRLILAKTDVETNPFFVIDTKDGSLIQIEGKILFEKVKISKENKKIIIHIKINERDYFSVLK